MTLGEIKTEALRLMFCDAGEGIAPDNLAALYDSAEYKDYLARMNGSVNRALGRVESLDAVPYKTHTLTADEGTVGLYYTRYDLPTIIADYGRIQRLVREKGYSYHGNAAFRMEGNVLVLPNTLLNEYYTVVYAPTLARLPENASDTSDIGLPYEIAALIPYHVKADLLEEEEPNLAANARAIFERAMVDRAKTQECRLLAVTSVYGGAV